jgi:hypothetical protein
VIVIVLPNAVITSHNTVTAPHEIIIKSHNTATALLSIVNPPRYGTSKLKGVQIQVDDVTIAMKGICPPLSNSISLLQARAPP